MSNWCLQKTGRRTTRRKIRETPTAGLRAEAGNQPDVVNMTRNRVIMVRRPEGAHGKVLPSKCKGGPSGRLTTWLFYDLPPLWLEG
jgi:hypothetical protein